MKKKLYQAVFLFCLAVNLFMFNRAEAQAGWQDDIMNRGNEKNMKTYNGFQYMDIPETDYVRIVGYVGTESIVMVPSEIEGKQVKAVVGFGDYLNEVYGQKNEAPREIYIPDGVEVIGGFMPCVNLEKIQIPESVVIIIGYAFKYCQKLKVIELPSGLTKIDDDTFYYCTRLEKVNIPSGVKEIGESAFSDCRRLKEIVLPDGLEKIGQEAFADCRSLKEISIPDSVVYLGPQSFVFCDKLSKVKLSKNLAAIQKDCFLGCNLRSIQIPLKVNQIESRAFGANQKLTEITIPSKVKKIGFYAFGGCTKLKKITIKGTNTKIIKKAFEKIHPKAVFDVPNKQIKKYKKMLVDGKNFKEGKMKIK